MKLNWSYRGFFTSQVFVFSMHFVCTTSHSEIKEILFSLYCSKFCNLLGYMVILLVILSHLSLPKIMNVNNEHT